MKKLLLLLLIFTSLPVFAGTVIKSDRHGYYVDGTGQIPEYQRIAPPNDVTVTPKKVRGVEPFETAYDVNIKGYRRGPYKTPIIPNYNTQFSTRRTDNYTRADYMDVWCSGTKDYARGVCSSKDYNIYFYRARNWSIAVMGSAWKNKHAGKERAIFLMVDDIVTDAVDMSDAKRWSQLYNIPIYFATIDSYIPLSWIVN